jgi:hypothetical protein
VWEKENVFEPDAFLKLKALAAGQSMSVKSFIVRQMEALISKDESYKLGYERAKRHALASLKRGLPLRGNSRASRDELHSRSL